MSTRASWVQPTAEARGHTLIIHAFVIVVKLAVFDVLHKSRFFFFSLPQRLRRLEVGTKRARRVTHAFDRLVVNVEEELDALVKRLLGLASQVDVACVA